MPAVPSASIRVWNAAMRSAGMSESSSCRGREGAGAWQGKVNGLFAQLSHTLLCVPLARCDTPNVLASSQAYRHGAGCGRVCQRKCEAERVDQQVGEQAQRKATAQQQQAPRLGACSRRHSRQQGWSGAADMYMRAAAVNRRDRVVGLLSYAL